VGLSFGGIPERLTVAFSAIKSFLDPSVQFGLSFEPAEGAAENEAPMANLPASPAPSAVAVPAPATAAVESSETSAEPERPSEGAEVVRLDRFRKK